MADEIVIGIKGDTTDIKSKLGDLENSIGKAAGAIGDAFSNPFVKGAGALALFGGALAGAGAALKVVEKSVQLVGEAINLAFEGEKIKALNAQFEIFSQSAGQSGAALKEALGGAAGGLVDDTAILESANKALIELGTSASRLPETLDLAKKATSIFGGEVVNNFELINAAVATGNTRSLRQIGIIIDSEKAFKDYAKSIGASVESLNQHGRQQAILNATLEKAAKNFADVDPAIRQNETSLKQLTVTIKDIGEVFLQVFDRTIGPAINSVLTGLNAIASAIQTNVKAAFGTGFDQGRAQIVLLNQELDGAIQLLDNYKKQLSQGSISQPIFDQQAKQVENLRAQIELLQEEQRKLAGTKPLISAEETSVDPEKAAESLRRRNAILFELRKTQADQDLQLAQSQQDKFNALEEQKSIVSEQFELKRQELVRQLRATGLTEQQANDAVEIDLTLQKANAISLIEQQQNQQSIDRARQLGSTINAGLTNGISQGVQAIVKSLRSGENAFNAFSKVILSSLGDLAIQSGTLFISYGIGIESLKTLSGAAAIAAGIGLIAIGTLIKSFVGGGAGEAGGGVGAAGGGGFGTSQATQATQIAPATPETRVNVNIQGNVLDRRETGLAIAEVLQEQFNNNGALSTSGNF